MDAGLKASLAYRFHHRATNRTEVATIYHQITHKSLRQSIIKVWPIDWSLFWSRSDSLPLSPLSQFVCANLAYNLIYGFVIFSIWVVASPKIVWSSKHHELERLYLVVTFRFNKNSYKFFIFCPAFRSLTQRSTRLRSDRTTRILMVRPTASSNRIGLLTPDRFWVTFNSQIRFNGV